MDTIDNTAPVDSFTRFCSNSGKFSLFVFLLLIFFGFTVPFQERYTDVADITTSSPINQVVFSALYVLAFISLLPKRHLVYQLIRTEKFLTIFLIWAFFTIFWSEVPLVSFKRWIRNFGMVLIIISGFLYLKSSEDVMQFFKAILSVYLTLSILSVLFVPGATMENHSAWRGIAMHKNTLGQISLASLIIWCYAFYRGNLNSKLYALLFLGLSLILLIGSKSTSALLTAMVLFAFVGFQFLDKNIFRHVVGGFISSIFFITLFISFIFVLYLAQDFLSFVPELFGKDLTFSGRIYLWEDVFIDAKTHMAFGCGFGGYWVVGSRAMDEIWNNHSMAINQAHLGYLDLLNETGLIGFILFVCMIIYYLINLLKLEKTQFWSIFFISAIVFNLQETSFFIPMNITGVLFILSYLVLYVNKVKSTNDF
jgi:O-antigen ligase